MSADRDTLALYNARAADYAEIVKSDTPGALLRGFIDALPPRATVLDLGCGPGTDARHMAEAGLCVTAMDAAVGMVAMAAVIPGVAVIVQDFDGFTQTAAPHSFDGIWANFSLLHAPRDRMEAILSAIARALRPGGILHIAVKTGDGSARDSLGRLYTYYTPDDLTARLVRAGLHVTHRRDGRETGFDGMPAAWVALRARLAP